MKRLFAVLVVSACATATSFEGEAKIPNGPKGCALQCQAWGMDLIGMIAMGEYSDGCICQVRGAPQGSAAVATSAAGPATAGVVMQMQRAQKRQQAAAAANARR